MTTITPQAIVKAITDTAPALNEQCVYCGRDVYAMRVCYNDYVKVLKYLNTSGLKLQRIKSYRLTNANGLPVNE